MRTILFLFALFNIGFSSNIFCQNFWEKIQSPTTKILQKVIFVDSLTGWAAGDSGIIIHTSDAGNNWNIQNYNVDYNILSVSFPKKNLGWALARTYFGSDILKTCDGGNSWKNQSYNGQDTYLQSIYFADSLNGWIGGLYGGILYSTDGGLLWNQAVIDSFSNTINDFTFANNNYGFAYGGHTDYMGVIYKTTDGGKNWTGKSVAADPIQKLCFLDSLNIVGIGGDLEFGSGFIKSTNAGVDWTYRILNIRGTGLGLSFRTASEAWATIKYLGKFLVTYDTGNTWKEYFTPDSISMSDIIFTDSLHGYAVGDNGVVLKYMGVLSSVQVPVEVPLGFSLKQNYPNPFNPSTTISFFIPEKASVKLKIYDIMGREVKSFEKHMEIGEHNFKFTPDKLSTGVYFYNLIANNFQASKKMIFLK
jgi:photosystem II stability/assembly factor-like uncharacterized protein